MRTRTRRGFTLIELAVVLALVALALGVGISTLSDVLSNNRIRSTAQQVSDAIQLARSEAVKRNLPVQLTVSNGALTLNFNGGGACGTDQCRVITFSTASGLSVTVDGASDRTLQFDSYGQLVDALNLNHQIDIANGRCAAEQSCLRVQLRAGGALRICNPGQGDTHASNFCAV